MPNFLDTIPSAPSPVRFDNKLEQLPALELRVRSFEAAVRAASLPVRYVGIERLFEWPRLYNGNSETGWVMTPLAFDPAWRHGRFPIPQDNLRQLQRLGARTADVDPLIFVAHEVVSVDRTLAVPRRGGYAPVEPSMLARIISPAPPCTKTLETSERLGRVTTAVGTAILSVMGAAAVAAAGIAVAPLAALSALPVDPIIFGAVPATDNPFEGAPAGWFVLAQWSW